MKNTNTCPKCNSKAIIETDNNLGKSFNPIRIGPLSVADTARYICCDCGYMEEWLTNPKDLKKLKKKNFK